MSSNCKFTKSFHSKTKYITFAGNKSERQMEKSGWAVIVNPKAGSGRGLADWPVISNAMFRSGLEFVCYFTEHKYHTVELTVSAVKDGYRKIVAVGGDGTLHEVVNGIFLQQYVPADSITIGVIPTGTGNDRARGAGLHSGYAGAIKALCECNTKLQDAGVAEYTESGVRHTRYIVNAAGAGFVALVNSKYNWLKDEGKRGRWLYFYSKIASLFRYRAGRYVIKEDGKRVFKGRLFVASAGIGVYSGGGLIALPDALFDDSLFDLLVVRMTWRLRLMFLMKELQKGNGLKSRKVLRIKASEIVIESYPGGKVEMDGEALGFLPVRLKIIPKALRFVELSTEGQHRQQ